MRAGGDPKAPEVFVNFFPPSKSASGSVMVEHLADKPSGMSLDDWFGDLKQKANLNPRLSEGVTVILQCGGFETESVYVVSEAQTFVSEYRGERPGVSRAESPGNYLTYQQMVKSFRIKRR